MSYIQNMKPELQQDRTAGRRMLAIAVVVAVAIFAGGLVQWAAAQKLSSKNKMSKFVQSNNEAANAIFQGGRDFISDEQWAKAAEKFNDYVNKYPKEKNVDAALYWMAYSQYQLKRYVPARSTITRLLNTYQDTTWKEDAKTLLAQMPVAPTPPTQATQPTPAVAPQEPYTYTVIEPGMAIGIGSGRGIGIGQSTTIARAGSAPADDDPCEFKIVVLQSLFQADVQRGIAAATDWLKPGSTQTLRCKGAALTLLARNGGKSVTPVILGVARNETDLKLRAKAISVLGATNDDSVIPTLRDFAMTGEPNEIAEGAVYALRQHSSPQAIAVLTEVATSSRPLDLRKLAIVAIAERPGEPSVDALFKIYDADQNLEMRKFVVIRGFGNRKSERAGSKLLEIARSSDNLELRKAAITAIGRRSGDQGVEILIGLYDSEKNEELKDQIINSLGYSSDPRITKKLIEIARNPQTPIERRRRAIGWLSRSKDPEVLKFLEELLK